MRCNESLGMLPALRRPALLFAGCLLRAVAQADVQPEMPGDVCPVQLCHSGSGGESGGGVALLERSERSARSAAGAVSAVRARTAGRAATAGALGKDVDYGPPMPALKLDVASETPSAEDEEKATFDIEFKPGHFICTKCDVSMCKDCTYMCPLSDCIGEFYTQECWCKKDYPKNDEEKKTMQVFCDADCAGGVCDTGGFTCAKREDACKPWYDCGLPPVAGEAGAPGPAPAPAAATAALLQEHSGAKAPRSFLRRAKASFLQSANRRLAEARQEGRRGREADGSNPAFLNFTTGRFVCGSASMPPKVRDPVTMLWKERGYLAMDAKACEGGAFDHTCFCWDQFKYLKGKDPVISELLCDEGCTFGGCEGKTCGTTTPGPLPAFFPAESQEHLRRAVEVTMEPMDDDE